MEQKFFICERCGNIIAMVKSSGVPVMCCGQQMKEIIPGTTDAAVEKHVPVYTVEGNKVMVTVGSAEHPMLPEHYIEWVSLQTKQGNQRKALKPGDAPKVCFAICEGDEVEAVYAYCNLHSLWKAERKSAGDGTLDGFGAGSITMKHDLPGSQKSADYLSLNNLRHRSIC